MNIKSNLIKCQVNACILEETRVFYPRCCGDKSMRTLCTGLCTYVSPSVNTSMFILPLVQMALYFTLECFLDVIQRIHNPRWGFPFTVARQVTIQCNLSWQTNFLDVTLKLTVEFMSRIPEYNNAYWEGLFLGSGPRPPLVWVCLARWELCHSNCDGTK